MMLKALKAMVLLIFLSFAGCVSTPSSDQLSCENSDWYEIGRRDGASGMTLDRLAGYRRDCGSQWMEQTENIYRNGRNAGLVEYCTGRNGFELGRMKINYNSVCPSTVEADFLKSYGQGEQAGALEIENQKLAARIDQLTQQLNSQKNLSDSQKGQISAELADLKKTRAENERQLNQISR